MKAFIKGIGIISPQKTFTEEGFLNEIVESNSNFVKCIEPSYKEFLDPILARRMGRIIKMSIAAAARCLKDAGVTVPDAIMTGTGMGCIEDTEKFLLSILDNDEQFLTPTSFMQSTHNTVSAQIALQLKCMNYNFTYVHKGFSFESAVLDALMTLEEGEGHNILVGGHDEITEKHLITTSRVNFWKKENVATMELIHSKTPGSIAGEGAAFFVLSDQPGEHDYAQLLAVKTIYKPTNEKEVTDKIEEVLKQNNLTSKDIDVVLYGISGDSRYDGINYQIKDSLFPEATATWYKHLSGEYQTSSSFALWVAAMIIKTQTIPEVLLIGENKRKPVNNVLIYNNYMGANHTVFLLSKC